MGQDHGDQAGIEVVAGRDGGLVVREKEMRVPAADQHQGVGIGQSGEGPLIGRTGTHHAEKASMRAKSSGSPAMVRWMAPTVSWSSASSVMRAITRSCGPEVSPL